MTTATGTDSSSLPPSVYDVQIEVTPEEARTIETYVKLVDRGDSIVLSDQFINDWIVVFLALMNSGMKTYTHLLPLSKYDAYRLHDIVPLEAQVGNTSTGINIRKKLYEALARTIDGVVELRYGSIDEPTYKDVINGNGTN